LGLATVYGIVNQAGGHITIYSEQYLGTTVKVYLPVSEEQAVSVAKPEESEVPASLGGTILLVEDEELVRDPAARFLVQRGFEVIVAADPHQALKLSAEHEGDIDLLLTDVVMPGMSGKELAETIKESRTPECSSCRDTPRT
jgi:two-component system cell cycle sensor histidine kinase/response regulator CckA